MFFKMNYERFVNAMVRVEEDEINSFDARSLSEGV